MQNYQENFQNLPKCTVAIKRSSNDSLLGTGIIVTEDGLILTCYHVIGDHIHKNITQRNVNIYFPSNPNVKGSAEVIDRFCDPELDIAFLKLKEKLPELTAVIELGETIYPKEHDFQSFGFRNPEGTTKFDGLQANGTIQGMTRLTSRNYATSISPPLITLKSNQIAKGMSGSPILDIEINKVVGIVSDHFDSRYLSEDGDVYNTLSLGIPVESIIKVNPDLKKNNPGLSYLDKIAYAYISDLNKNIQEKHLKLKIKDIESKCLRIKFGDTIVSDKDLIDYNDENNLEKDNADKIINQFLESEDQFLLISSTFGMGKSILVEKLADKMCRSFLGEKLADNIINENIMNHYFPILLNSFPYHSKAFDEFQINTLEEFIEKIRCVHKKILFIIDEFDLQKEYLNSDNNSISYIKEKKLKEILNTINIQLKDKIIFTSRISNINLIHNFLSSNLNYSEKIKTSLHYIRLLSLERDDVLHIFRLFNNEIDEGDSQEILIKYLDMKFDKYPNNFIKYPHLFISIFSSKYKAEIESMHELLKEKEFQKDFSSVTIPYILFFSSIILGKKIEDYEKIFGNINQNGSFSSARIERLVLRELAALEFIEKDELLYNRINTHLGHIKYEENFSTWLGYNIYLPNNKDQILGKELLLILDSYFIINENRIFKCKFYNEEIRNFLIAEHYITYLINKEVWYRLNIGLPSENTIDFLKSILILISIVKEPNSKIKLEFVHILRQYIQTYKLSEDDNKNLKDAEESKEQIIRVIFTIISRIDDNCKDIIKKSSFIITSYNERRRPIIDPKEEWWHILEDKNGEYKIIEKETFELIIHNILAFFVRDALDLEYVRESEIAPENIITTEKILLNIFRSCNTIPDKLKRFNNLPLEQTNLRHINLHRADLRRVNLKQSNLQYANLSNANLDKVYLYGADLSGANLSGANLHNSNLEFANLSGVDLSGANLTNCVFNQTLIIGCKINNRTKYPQSFKQSITDNPNLIKGMEKAGIEFLTEEKEVEKFLEDFYSKTQFYNIDTGKIQKLSKSEQRLEIDRCKEFSYYHVD
jgi:hypothetical protein